MRPNAASFILGLCLTCCATCVSAQTEQKCPVSIDHIDVSFNHADGQSKPQFRASFTNKTKKRISTLTFTLSLLDSGGYPQPYQDSFVYSDGLDAGRQKLFAWDLDSASVDMHRTGQSALLDKAEFADGTDLVDDGSQSCVLTVDFHAK